MHRTTFFAVLAAVLLAALAPASAGAQTYTLTDLGALASGPTIAADISPAGVVTGGLTVTGSGTAAALWTPGSGGYTFQNLGFPSGSNYNPAYGANDSSQLAVTGGNFGGSISWENGFLWSGKWTDLTSKTKQSEALAINASALVAGGAFPSQGNIQATLWKSGKQYTLPTGTPGPYGAIAFGINDSGQVVGFGGTGPQPFVWTPNTPNGTTGTTTFLPVSGGRALGINSLGDVVGETQVQNGIAFYRDHSTGTVTILGTLPGGSVSTARKVNKNGQVVGNTTFPDGSTRGFLWDSVNGMRDLNSLTIAGGIPAGWVFTCPYTRALVAVNIPLISINDAGQICGTASVTVNGVTTNHAFLLTPQ